MATAGKHGVTANTPQNIMLGAGTIHKGLKYTPGEGMTAGSWNFADTIVGATSGGSKFSITPEMYTLPVDGALVATKGLTVKNGETATMDVNFIELNVEVLKAATIGTQNDFDAISFALIESKPRIEEGDYWDNIAYVGKTTTGEDVIVIMDNALCTSGLNMESKNKEASVSTFTFTCHGDMTGDLDVLPWHVYWPTPLVPRG